MRRWPSRTYMKALGVVLLADLVLLSVAAYLDLKGIRSDLIAVPVFVLNLPALPLALYFAVFLEDPLSKLQIAAMWGSLLIVTSMVWAAIIRWKFTKRV